MKSLILYGSPVKLSNAHHLVTHDTKSKFGKTPRYYVRCNVCTLNLVSALDHVKPLPGETVLNTVEYPE